MAGWEYLGPCTIEIADTAGGTGVDFAGEFTNVYVLHEYEEKGSRRTMLDESVRKPSESRIDGVRGHVENDLTAAGLYKLLYDDDLQDREITITQTASGASWVGMITLKLPAQVGADELGTPIVSDVEWKSAGVFAFTPATAAP